MTSQDPDEPDLREVFRAAKDAGSDQARKQILLNALRKVDPERAKRFNVTDTVVRGDGGGRGLFVVLSIAAIAAGVWWFARH